MTKLLYRDPRGEDAEVILDGEVVTIGRDPESAIGGGNMLLSRRHARVHCSEGRWWIEDVASTSGVFVNDRRIERHRLSHDDVVTCGGLRLRYVEDDRPMPEAQPQPRLAADEQRRYGEWTFSAGKRSSSR